jgi:putative ABC transport system permease protein
MNELWMDLRFGLRMLRKTPAFTAVAIAILALGIGVNATVFSLTNGALFKGLPFDKSDRIIYMLERDTTHNNQLMGISFPDFRDWREQAKSYEGMAAASGRAISVSDNNALPESYTCIRQSANGFHLIGQRPLIGRDFISSDETAGAPPVVILSYGLWERRYGKSASLIGQTIRVEGIPTTVIGVMPKGFEFPYETDVWMPLVPTVDSEKRHLRGLIVYARLADGVNLKSARAEMNTISQRLQSAYPDTNRGVTASVQTFNDFYIGPTLAMVFLAMLGAVGFVLLIACANVANLLLGRTMGRSREISIRVALGAGRWRVIRQLLVESVILSLAGGVLGWFIGMWGVRIFDLKMAAFWKPAYMNFSMDYKVFIYLLVISVGTGVIAGLAPALRLAKFDVSTALKDGGRGSSTGAHGRRLSSVLVIAEIALAVILLVGAGLTIRSFVKIYDAPLGVDSSKMLTFRLPLPEARYPTPEAKIAFHDRLHTRLASLPGVAAVAITTYLPTGGSDNYPYELEGAPSDEQHRPVLSALVIGPDYFRVMGTPVITGRSFTDTDGASGPPVVIVNQSFASKFLAGREVLGQRLRIFEGSSAQPWLTVVGVVPNILQNDISPRQIDPLIYMPFRQKPTADMAFVARTLVPPGNLKSSFQREIQAADPDLAVYRLWTMDERLERNYWFSRIVGVVFGIFAVLALLLASTGLYSVIANSVSQRTQELGVRIAMGATARHILQLIFTQGMRDVAIGIAVGLAGAFAVARILQSFLVGVSPVDPVTFGIAAAVLILAAVLGCMIPARRATRVDPMVALRHE